MRRWIYFIKFGAFLAIISSNILSALFSLSSPSGMLRMYILVCFMEFHRSVYLALFFFFFPVLRPENLSWLFWFFPLLAQICDWAPLVNSSRVSLIAQLGKESACIAGAPGRFLGQEDGEGNGNPLQYSWASLVAQLVKNPPAIQETWVRSLGWEDPLEKEKATHSSILAWRILWTLCRVT